MFSTVLYHKKNDLDSHYCTATINVDVILTGLCELTCVFLFVSSCKLLLSWKSTFFSWSESPWVINNMRFWQIWEVAGEWKFQKTFSVLEDIKYIKDLKYKILRDLTYLSNRHSYTQKLILRIFTKANLNEKATEYLQLSFKIYKHFLMHL